MSGTEYLTTAQASAELQVKKATVLGMISKGYLQAIDVSVDPDSRRPSWRIPREALDELLRSRMKKQRAAKPSRAVKTAPARFYA